MSRPESSAVTERDVVLWRTTAADGVRLDGALHRGRRAADGSSSAAAWNLDAALLVHGTGGNFYSPGLLETFADDCTAAGLDVLRVNTRGHDGMATSSVDRSTGSGQGPVAAGAAFESLADCRFDLRAWLDRLVEAGRCRVLLVGHSVGAVKSLWYAAQETHPAVVRILAITPPRFAHRVWQTDPRAGAFRESYAEAERLVAAGRPDELLTVSQPLPLVLAAAGFLAKYGPHDDFDHILCLPRIRVPVRIVLGSQSVADSPAFASLPEALDEIAARHAQVTWRLVPGANTGYAGQPHAPFEELRAWLDADRPSPDAAIAAN